MHTKVNTRRTLIGLGLAISLVFVASGCGQAAEKLTEKAIEKSAGGDVDVNSDDGSVKFTDEEGNVSEFGTADLPKDWPSELAPGDNVTLISSSTQTVDGEVTMFLLGELEGDVDSVYAGVKSQITDAGYKISGDSTISGATGGYAAVTAANGTNMVTATVTSGDGEDKVALSMSISPDNS